MLEKCQCDAVGEDGPQVGFETSGGPGPDWDGGVFERFLKAQMVCFFFKGVMKKYWGVMKKYWVAMVSCGFMMLYMV